MVVKNKLIKDLIRAEYNPRELTKDQYNQLKDSLTRFGIVDPVIVNVHEDRKNIIIGGHQRCKVWEDLGNTEIPTVELELTLEQERELNVRLNKNTGQFDMDMLANHFDTTELIEWGFDEDELIGFDEVELEAEEDDFQVNDNIETDIVLGDLFEIGEHRLLCGDSTNSDDVEKLMNGEKADMVFTDPPYNIGYSGTMSNTTKDGVEIGHVAISAKYDDIKNDKMSESEFSDFMTDVLKEIQINCSGAFYICFGSQTLNQLLQPLSDLDIEYKSIIIWEKNQSTISGKDFKSCYEPIIYGRFNDGFFGDRFNEEDIWKFQRTLKNDLHPTMKPIPLIENALNKSSKSGMKVLDLFLGSGSTMVASHQLNRKCYGMEMEQKYCQVIVDRMMKLDPALVVKRNGEPYIKPELETS